MQSLLFTYLVTFPFEQFGRGLRRLSLSGAAGNILAIILYVLASLLPCLLLFVLKKRGRLLKTDLCLPAFSIMLFVVLYFMVNPGLFHTNVSGTGGMLLGSTFYSALFGYLVLRVLESCKRADARRLKTYLQGLLAAITMLSFYAILSECVVNLSASVQNLGDAYHLIPKDLTAAYAFLALQGIVNALPYILAVFILATAARALNALLKDRYSDASVAAVEKLSMRCFWALTISVSSGIGFNILQLLFHRLLQRVNIVVSIPVFSIVFVLVILLLAEYVRENQRLKQDNDLFI